MGEGERLWNRATFSFPFPNHNYRIHRSSQPSKSDLKSSASIMSSSSVEDRDGGYGSGDGSGSVPSSSASSTVEKYKEKVRVSRMSLVHWHTHQNDVNVVKTLLEEDRSLVSARDYDSRTPLHVASLHGWIDVAKCLIDFGADINALDRWKNTVRLISQPNYLFSGGINESYNLIV